MRCFASALVAAVLPLALGEVYFKDTFDDLSKWTQSKAKEDMGSFTNSAGKWSGDATVQKGMMCPDDMKFYAATAPLSPKASSRSKDLVVQFSVKHEEHMYSFCGGGYVKLLPASQDPLKFDGSSEYNIMFGPDMCGYDTSLIHLIFGHKGENLLKTEKIPLEYSDKDQLTHLYTLHLKPDDTFNVYFDMESRANGTLLDGWPFPKPEIVDPDDKKPDDWVDEALIDDPEDKKPEGWDDIPKDIPDATAKKPDDWDDEDDGEWEAPRIPNPEYKGEWIAKRIDNPAYKGEWEPRKIPNPNYEPGARLGAYDDIGYVGFELWIVNNGTIFDNLIVTDSLDDAWKLAEETWKPFVAAEKEAKEKWDKENKPPEEEGGSEDGEDDDEDAFGGEDSEEEGGEEGEKGAADGEKKKDEL